MDAGAVAQDREETMNAVRRRFVGGAGPEIAYGIERFGRKGRR